MPIDIVEAATNKEKLLQEKLVRRCPECEEDWYSLLDRMMIVVYGRCYECDEIVSGAEALRHADNINAIL